MLPLLQEQEQQQQENQVESRCLLVPLDFREFFYFESLRFVVLSVIVLSSNTFRITRVCRSAVAGVVDIDNIIFEKKRIKQRPPAASAARPRRPPRPAPL